MQAPLCRLCEAKHWSNEPHHFVTNAPVVTNNVTNSVTNYSPEVARVLNWRKTHPDRYKETQKALMRKRRAKDLS